MKQKKLTKKLVLNKDTVAVINNWEEDRAKGGATGLSECKCFPTQDATGICSNCEYCP